MFNAQGAIVYNEEIFSKNHTVIITINTENLSGGLYMISVQGEKENQTKNIIIYKN
ncbi:MAG: T9SS type A sorting domain-containing protein [Cytophagales bacterium]|nr:T9SS type A sorting domain-containing protein [Cytophagales bacterium]